MINLLSPEIKLERVYGRRNVSLLVYSVVLLLTGVGIAGIMVGSLQFVGSDESNLRMEIKEANVEITALEGSIKEIESISTRLTTAKKLDDQSVKFSVLIPEIAAVLPKGVILNALTLTGGVTDALQLDIKMTDASLAPIFIRNLVESELFEAADLLSIIPSGGNENGPEAQYTSTASLTASFTGSAEAKRKAKASNAAAAEAQAAAGSGGQQ